MATPHFHSLRVREVRMLTSDAVALSFDVPAKLRDTFRFTQGQFVTLKTHIDGAETRRAYSICVGVGDYERTGELRVGIKRVPGGALSNFITDTLKPGHMIEVMPPDGRFYAKLDPAHRKHYVGFAGGSGITPILSLIATTLEIEPHSQFTLIYGNRGVASIMFSEELEDLKNRFLGRLCLYFVLSDEPQDADLFSGLLDQDKCGAFLDRLVPAGEIDEAFICGPAPMMDAAERALHKAGVAHRKIHIERFGEPMPAYPAAQALPVDDNTPAADLEVIADGQKRKLRLPYHGISVLDVGLRAGLALPYACKGGMCCTCRAKVLEGAVTMDKNYALEPHEVQAGFVLTCQCHPLSQRVVVSYDER
jgi:ring-1,2-phenylacetyl-CoA epoxidase subunit PaaE